jgi:hypothetical protein
MHKNPSQRRFHMNKILLLTISICAFMACSEPDVSHTSVNPNCGGNGGSGGIAGAGGNLPSEDAGVDAPDMADMCKYNHPTDALCTDGCGCQSKKCEPCVNTEVRMCNDLCMNVQCTASCPTEVGSPCPELLVCTP